MKGVSAVRVLTLFAIASLAAGGWLYQDNEADHLSGGTNEFDFDIAPMAADSGDSDGVEEVAREPESKGDVSASTFSDLSFGLIAGGAGTLGSLIIAAVVSEAFRVSFLVAQILHRPMQPWRRTQAIIPSRDPLFLRNASGQWYRARWRCLSWESP